MKAAMRVVSLRKSQHPELPEDKPKPFVIYAIYECVAIDVVEGQRIDQLFKRADGSMRSAMQNIIQFGLKDVGQGFADKLEIHMVIYDE